MKKIFLLVGLFFFIKVVGYTQTTSGNLLIGGNIGWSTYRDQEPDNQPYNSRQAGLTLTGYFGTFLKDNLAVGLLYRQQINLHTQENFSQTPAQTYDYTANNIIVGPIVRKYFVLGERFSFFSQAMLGYTTTYSKSQQNNLETSTSSFKGIAANLQPGIAFFASNKLSIDLSVPGLNYSFMQGRNEGTYQDFSVELNLPALNLGLNFFLNR